MTDPITPPLELVHQWADMLSSRSDLAVFTMAAQWGAARALLDQPAPEGPTDEEIMELMPQQMRDDLAAAAESMASVLAITGFERDSMKAVGVLRLILNRHAVDHARAVLAKYGSPTPQPVAVSGRLPEPSDCDEQGRCWAWNPEAIWWELFRIKFLALNAGDPYTHWLPANALPTPEATNV